ncbi:hypothetical protein [uncultured Serinicoccus sp.]|uniref:hypothetical protein n=1 Tax=uncultured Serinicoccus sp. TaxID=735514 RepID=UPI002624BB44|nr:hypothetical protein [uncultured Serinicoccus sp.]
MTTPTTPRSDPPPTQRPAPTTPVTSTPDRVRRAQRTAAWAGPLCVVAGVGTFAPEPPEAGTDPAGIRSHVEQQLDVLAVNAVCALVVAAALLVLVSALASLIESHRPDSLAGRYVTGVGVLSAAQLVVFASVYGVWVFVDPVASLDDATVVTLFSAGAFGDSFGSLTLVLTCSMVALVSWSALRYRFLSRPVAVFGLLVATGEIVSLGQLIVANPVSSTGMYVAIFGWFLWPAVVGLDLGFRLLRGRR